MKRKILIITLLFGVAFMVSCSKDDDEEKIPSWWEFGYFKGMVDDTYYNLSNSWKEQPVNHPIHTLGDVTDMAWSIKLDIPNSENYMVFRTRLFSLHRGSYLLYVSSDSVTILLNDNIVKSGCQVDFCIPVHMPPANEIKDSVVYYSPHADSPFRIDILNMQYFENSPVPTVEGEMNGVLYNEKDPNDAIVFQNVMFGIH